MRSIHYINQIFRSFSFVVISLILLYIICDTVNTYTSGYFQPIGDMSYYSGLALKTVSIHLVAITVHYELVWVEKYFIVSCPVHGISIKTLGVL